MIRGESRRASSTPGILSNLASYPQTKPQTFYLPLHLSASEVCLALMEIGSSSNQSSLLQLSLAINSYIFYVRTTSPCSPYIINVAVANSSPHPSLACIFAPSCLVYPATPCPVLSPLLPAEQIRGIKPGERERPTKIRNTTCMRGLMRSR